MPDSKDTATPAVTPPGVPEPPSKGNSETVKTTFGFEVEVTKDEAESLRRHGLDWDANKDAKKQEGK